MISERKLDDSFQKASWFQCTLGKNSKDGGLLLYMKKDISSRHLNLKRVLEILLSKLV